MADTLPPIDMYSEYIHEEYPHKTIVLGTHDVGAALKRAGNGWTCQHLINGRTAWLRLGYESGELRWIDDDVRGAACVVFDESDDPPEGDTQ